MDSRRKSMIGRWSDLYKQDEEKNLSKGQDFREPRFRREVFLRFYEFHLKWKAHPGAVYYMMPYLIEKLDLDTEGKLWMAYLNGCCQNIVTTYILIKEFPSLKDLKMDKFSQFFRENYDRWGWDTDRRYIKNKMERLVLNYKNITGGEQEEYFTRFLGEDENKNFDSVWNQVIQKFDFFGRLATFSYLEYLRIIGLDINCSNLFLEDIEGSKSHRNGLCKVLGRDDLDWHKEVNPNFKGYTKEQIEWLKGEGELLLSEAKVRFGGESFERDVNYFTLESTLCCYKSWHRKNRRYPNVYNDMFYERIKLAEKTWETKLDVFWEARKKYLHPNLRIEDNKKDLGFCKEKQNHYRLTGQVIVMDLEWDCFKNDLYENG